LGTTIFLGKIEIPWEIGVPKLALKEPKEIHTSRRLKWSWAVMQIPDPIHGLGMSKQFFSGDARKKRPLIMTANSIKADSPLGNRHGLLVLVSNWGPTPQPSAGVARREKRITRNLERSGGALASPSSPSPAGVRHHLRRAARHPGPVLFQSSQDLIPRL
jgi:hypothetical protein